MADESTKPEQTEEKPKRVKSAPADSVKVSLNPDFAADGDVFVAAAGIDPADADEHGRVKVSNTAKAVSKATAAALSASPAVKVEE